MFPPGTKVKVRIDREKDEVVMDVTKPPVEIWSVTHTDTFGGEANYLWCHRYTIEAAFGVSQRTIMRRAKAAAGLTGILGITEAYGDEFIFRPYGLNQILLVHFEGCE